MVDEIRDLDDVEALVWALAWPTAWAFSNRSCDVAAENADECVRLLRERRQAPAVRAISLAAQLVRAHGREADAVAVERAKIAEWLRDAVPVPDSIVATIAEAIERGEHDK